MAISSKEQSPGLLLRWTPTIGDFLQSASSSPGTSDTQQSNYEKEGTVPYKLLRDVWTSTPAGSRPNWRKLLSGSEIAFISPKPREKSDELKARLAVLQDLADRKAYKDLVKDVVPNQPDEIEYFSSYKEQLGFGIHVIVVMFTGYLVGYALFRSLFSGNAALHAAGGIFGMVVGMLVETLLFIIRTSNIEQMKKPRPKKTKKQTRYKID